MDSYQQPHHHYMRPPPPPPPQAPPPMAADPHFSHHHPPPPPPPSNSWFSGQFQYHPSHSPSPPPPPPPQQHQQQNQWGLPPPPPPPPPYSAQPHQPYPAQPYPPPPPPSQPPPYSHQDWTNANWSHHSAWEYQAPAPGNEEDWAAKARAWASARSAVDNQHPPQTQFTSVARQEEPSHYANQYAQPVESHYQDVQQTSIPTSSFQNYQGPVAPLSRPPIVHQQEPASISSYASDAHFSFATKDATPCGDMNAAFPRHQVSTSSFVHQQEVPSSYYSVPGREDGSQGHQHGHSLLPNDGRSIPMNHAQFAYGNHPPDPMDQPLDFVPRYSHENDPKMNSNYPDSSGQVRGMDSVSAVSSLHSWTSQVAPGESYPPMTPAFPSAPQHDPSIGLPPLPGQPVPMFGRGPSFQPAVPSITAPVGLGTSSLHPTAAFPTDTYGASLGSERPKKAAVPNWLREEIIKNKATITTSVPEPSKEESQSNEDEIIGRSTAKGDQADSKSMDSARSAEEEDDDDEDYEEAQRTAAMNQEIKRVLTEVLLKVTDDLFDEIATKVLSEDDLDADAMTKAENHVSILKSSPPHPPVPVLQASAKVLIPVKTKESDGHASGESSSGTIGAGNVLGLANYASDDEDEIQTSGVSKSDTAVVYDVTENGHQQHEAEDHRNVVVTADAHHSNGSSTGAEGDHVPSASKLRDLRTSKDLDNVVQQASTRSSMFLGKRSDGAVADEQSVVKSDAAMSTDNDRKADFSQPDVPTEKEISRKSYKDNSQERDARRHDRHESRRSSSGRDNDKEIKSGKEREAEKEGTLGRQDEKRQKKDKTEDNNISREKSKELDGKRGEKVRESDSRGRSPHREDKDSKKQRERDKKRSGKDDVDKKRERTKDEKGDKSRHKSSSDASRHKRRRSSSVGSRDRKNEESTAAPDASDAETSDDSKRKVHSKRRNLSPSPVRSRQRQVSRSPHSKHSQRRHSPYSSLDDSRGRRSRARSRSRSPVRRRK